MVIRRRDFIVIAACALVGAGSAITALASTQGPILWSVKRNGATVYIFGFADAKDRSWLTPSIESAFRESQEVWFETPQDDAPAEPSQSDAHKPPDDGPSPLEKELGYDNQRSLFEVLGPRLADRTLQVARDLKVSREELEHSRPWLAFFVINNAFRKKFALPQTGDDPDGILAQMALSAHKRIHSELPTNDDVLRFFANLSDEAQREHVEDLLDYIRDQKAGRNKQSYGWITGHPDSRFIDRMRHQRPALYEAMHVRRNKEWAARISGFFSTGGVYFVCLGMNHILGPDSVLRDLARIGIAARRV
jgi:uncharacterized protein YbaP (TraB family)